MAQQIFFGIYWNLLDSTVFYCIYSYISPRYKLWFVTPVGFVSRYLPFGGSEGGADHKTQDWGLKVDESGTVSLPTMWAACRQICRTVMNTTIARALIIGNACLKWFGHVALWKDWKRFPGAGLFTMRQFSLAASGSMFGCRRRSRFALWCIRSEDLNSALTVSGCPWCLICLCFRCCCFETGMLWYVMMSYMLLISVLFACGSEAVLFPSSLPSLPLETCGDCSLSPHDLSAYMEDAGKVPVWAADLYESFLRFKNLTSQHSLGSQLTNAPFLAGDWWKRMLYSYTLYIYEIVFSVSVH
jgi:hypothetical protein